MVYLTRNGYQTKLESKKKAHRAPADFSSKKDKLLSRTTRRKIEIDAMRQFA